MSDTKSSNVEIRRLWSSDMGAFRDHLLRLDPQSRHQRFGGGMSDDSLVRYAEHCSGRGDLLYGAYVDGQMVGAAELRSNSAIWSEQARFGRHIQAEAAFSVEEPYRRRGSGEELFKRIRRAATNHGVETIEIICLPDNVGMRMLAQKFKTHFTFEEGRLKVRLPTPLSLIREASGDMLDLGAAGAALRPFENSSARGRPAVRGLDPESVPAAVPKAGVRHRAVLGARVLAKAMCRTTSSLRIGSGQRPAQPVELRLPSRRQRQHMHGARNLRLRPLHAPFANHAPLQRGYARRSGEEGYQRARRPLDLHEYIGKSSRGVKGPLLCGERQPRAHRRNQYGDARRLPRLSRGG